MKYLWNLLPKKFMQDVPFGTDGIFVLDSHMSAEEVAISDGYLHYRSCYAMLIINIIDYKSIRCVVYPDVMYPKREVSIPLSLINETEESISSKSIPEIVHELQLLERYEGFWDYECFWDTEYAISSYDNTFDPLFKNTNGGVFEIPLDLMDDFIAGFLRSVKSFNDDIYSIEQIPQITSDMVMRARGMETPKQKFGSFWFTVSRPAITNQETARTIFNWVSPYDFKKSCRHNAIICYEMFAYYMGKLLVRYRCDHDYEYMTKQLNSIISTPILYFNANNFIGTTSLVKVNNSGDVIYVDSGCVEIESDCATKSDTEPDKIIPSLDVYFLNFDKVRFYYCFYENFVVFRPCSIMDRDRFSYQSFDVACDIEQMREFVVARLLNDKQNYSND